MGSCRLSEPGAEPRTYFSGILLKILFVPVLHRCFISQANLDLEFARTVRRMRFLSFALLASLAFAALAEEEAETTAFSKVRIESCAG